MKHMLKSLAFAACLLSAAAGGAKAQVLPVPPSLTRGAPLLSLSPAIITPTILSDGAADGVTYCFTADSYGANLHTSYPCGQTTAAVTTSAVAIMTIPSDGGDIEVCGLSGVVKFCDKIQANLNHGGVVYTDTGTGSPAARTYAFPGAGVVNLTMASGTYSINAFGTVAGTR